MYYKKYPKLVPDDHDYPNKKSNAGEWFAIFAGGVQLALASSQGLTVWNLLAIVMIVGACISISLKK